MSDEHEFLDESTYAQYQALCSCGRWSGQRPITSPGRGVLHRAHAEHVRLAEAAELAGVEAARVVDAVAWFKRTGHCHACGQPGDWCQCPDTKRDRCGCHELHPVGSGIGRDPAAVYADQPPQPVEQDGLFEATP